MMSTHNICWFENAPNDHITAKEYEAILQEHMHPMTQAQFPHDVLILQDDDFPEDSTKQTD